MESEYICPPEFNQTENLRKLFVSGVPKDVSDEELKEFFSAYGEIENAFLNRKGSETKSKLFGFITFAHCDDVDECLLQKPIKFKGCLLDAKRAVPKDYSGENSQLRVKQLYISNVTPKLTEQELRDYLEKRHPPRFGAIGDIVLKKRVGDDGRATSENRGFGFITVSSEDFADRIAFGDAQFNIGGMSRPQMIVKATPRDENAVQGGGMPMRARGRGERGPMRGMDRGGMRGAPRGDRFGRGFGRGGDGGGRGFGRGLPRGVDRGGRGFGRGGERGGRGFSRGGGYSDGGYGQGYEEDYGSYRDREGFENFNDGGKDGFRSDGYPDEYGVNAPGGFREESFPNDYGQSYGTSDTRDVYRSGDSFASQGEEPFTASTFKEDFTGAYKDNFAVKDTYAGYDDPYARDSAAAAQTFAQEAAVPQAAGGFSRGMSAPPRGSPIGQRARGRGRGAPRGAGYVSY